MSAPCRPFWETRHIRGETVVFAEEHGAVTGHLAFCDPHGLRLVSRDGTLLREGRDYAQCGDRIELLDRTLPYFREGWLQNIGVPPDVPSENEAYGIEGCLLVSPRFLRSVQFLADYRCARTAVPAVLPETIALPRTRRALNEKKQLTLALFGDSVCNAANSSWEMGFRGYRHWMDIARARAEQAFGAKIALHNVSRSGHGTEWGLEAVAEKFGTLRADLVVMGLGGNDAAAGMPPERYLANVREILRRIRALAPETEFVLLSPTPQNPDCPQVFREDLLRSYVRGLRALTGEGVTAVDLTGVCEFLLRHKRYCEISGNNLNHPNDFWYRFYTDAFTQLFGRLKTEHGS